MLPGKKVCKQFTAQRKLVRPDASDTSDDRPSSVDQTILSYKALLSASAHASIGPARQKSSLYPHGCESCETSGEVFYSCPTGDLQGECIEAWMNNVLPNGCYGNIGSDYCLSIGCVPNTGIHTFSETCASNGPCPDGSTLQNNQGTVNFECPDAVTEDNCWATFGPDFHLAPCLELGCVLSDGTTYEEWCETTDPSDGGTGITTPGPNGCPSDCKLMHSGSINFICPDSYGYKSLSIIHRYCYCSLRV